MKDPLDELAKAHGHHLEVHRDPDFVCANRTSNRPKVALVSGCGAGNAPLATGYVGIGLLDAACPGPGFNSPGMAQIVAASKAVATGEGILHIVPHLKGDAEVFQAAADALRDEGFRVRDVVIDDDISSRDPRHVPGRRALGTVIAAARICGAAARADLHLNRVTQICKQVNTFGKGLAATLTSGTVLKNAEAEIGSGLTGEAGIATLPIAGPYELARELTSRLLADVPFTRWITEWDLEHWRWHEVEVKDTSFRNGDEMLLLVSSLGPKPICDLDEFADMVCEVAAIEGIRVVRRMTGHLMSAPNPNGVSVTLVKMTDELLRYWDAPVQSQVFGDLH